MGLKERVINSELIEKTPSQRLREYILSHPSNEEFSFDSIVKYAKKENITTNKTLINFICLSLEAEELIELDYERKNIISNAKNLEWAWDLSINICEDDGFCFSKEYLDLANRNLNGELSQDELTKRVRI